MCFSTDGSSHRNGVKNEKEIVEYFKRNPDNIIIKMFEFKTKSAFKDCKHKGGTKQKRDAVLEFEDGREIGVSIKNHKIGTFDWLNTTRISLKFIKELNEAIKYFKEKNENIDNITVEVRNDLSNLLSSHLDKITSVDITILLNTFLQKMEGEETKYILINSNKAREFIMLHISVLYKYFSSKNNHTFILKKTRAKTSRQIWIKTPDGKEINTNLRLRLHLNNGITALLGKSKSNKSSHPCIKIQQDKVDDFIRNCEGKIILKY